MPLTITSIPKNIAHVEHYLQSVFNEHRLNTDLYADVLVSLTEAVNNAMVHGNAMDDNKKVHIHSTVGAHTVEFTVSDQGPGFDPKDIPDPRDCDQRILEEGGRGLMLMKALSHDICFKDGGSTVILTFQRQT